MDSSYYFINHTRKEFCQFGMEVSVLIAMKSVMNDKTGWTTNHNIRVHTEDSESEALYKEYVDNEEYKDISTVL